MNLTKLFVNIARVAPAGLSPIAPGTCGSFVAILLAPYIFMPFSLGGRIIALLVLFVLGTFVSSVAEFELGVEDPGEVVIDEVLGQWITCLPFASLSPWGYLLAFILFRFFDILKPAPVRMAEKLPSGLGIMADDAVAGVLAMLCMAIFYYLGGDFFK